MTVGGGLRAGVGVALWITCCLRPEIRIIPSRGQVVSHLALGIPTSHPSCKLCLEIKRADHLPKRLDDVPGGNAGANVGVLAAKRGHRFPDALYQLTPGVGAGGHVG